MKLPNFLNPNPRPYWHVDAKWISGIFLLLFLTATLLLSTAVKITDEERAPKIAATLIGSMFIRGDSLTLDEIDEYKKQIKKEGGSIHPIPNMPEIVITSSDLDLPVSELKLKVFQPLTDDIYQNGVEYTAKSLVSTKKEQEKFINDASLLRIFTKETHQTLVRILPLLITISSLLLLLVAFFSYNWGRLANPGLVLIMVGLPGALLGLIFKNASQTAFGLVPADLAQDLGSILLQVYGSTIIIGLVLVVAALIGKIVSSILGRTQKHTPDMP